MQDYKVILNDMIIAAVGAGKIIMKYYNGDFSVATKSDSTPVTDADIASSDFILGYLRERYPTFGFLSEECADELDLDGVPTRLGKAHCFIIDPLDGTRSFVKRSGEFAVSIALSAHNEVTAGVVYAPVTGALYYALKDHGSYKAYVPHCSLIPKLFEGERLSVSSRKDKLIAVQSEKRSDERAEALLAANEDRVATVLRVGSCLKGCLIAEGRADIHYRFASYTKEWDTAGEEIICREAGGVFTDAYGNKLSANREDYANVNGIRILNSIDSALDLKP